LKTTYRKGLTHTNRQMKKCVKAALCSIINITMKFALFFA
jgi:hypothetical protein